MSSETEPEVDHIFPLLLKDGKTVFYESIRKAIFVNSAITQSLSPRQDQIFGYLLRHPNSIHPIQFFFQMLYPYDLAENTPRRTISETINPFVFALRHRLELVDEALPKTIKTVRSEGLVYIPDESTLMWQRDKKFNQIDY